MRMLSGVETPDTGERVEGHQMVMQYFAQDEAAKLDPTQTVYSTLAGSSPIQMVPHIRTILGGFLFSGDDIEKPVRVLSGGERTRLAVARMLLRPANTLLLDEPTNHLDLDSKDVLLDALEDFGGTLIFVSHDRYFVDKLATKIIEIGHGDASVYPGTYEEFLWSKRQRSQLPITDNRKPMADEPRAKVGGKAPVKAADSAKPGSSDIGHRISDIGVAPKSAPSFEEKKRADAEARKARRESDMRQKRITELEGRIAAAESAIKELEAAMSSPGFYENHEKSKPVLDRHQALMWEVGDLMNKWEALQAQTEV
jgi:ATP-binding cassette subfamily F protein 3